MFQLSQIHNQAFQAKSEADFVREVVQYLRENHAETVVKLPNDEFKVGDLSQKTLQKMVEGGIAKAGSYGITWQVKILDFVTLMFSISPNFWLDEKVKNILESEIIPPNWRVNSLVKRLNTDEWELIRNHYDSEFWTILTVKGD